MRKSEKEKNLENEMKEEEKKLEDEVEGEKKLQQGNRTCFLFYLAAKEVVKKYQELLNRFNLTYTQYLTMNVLWEKNEIDMKELGNILYLDSSTLTPVVNKLVEKGYAEKYRDENDKRLLNVKITESGMLLKSEVQAVPKAMFSKMGITDEEGEIISKIINKVVKNISD